MENHTNKYKKLTDDISHLRDDMVEIVKVKRHNDEKYNVEYIAKSPFKPYKIRCFNVSKEIVNKSFRLSKLDIALDFSDTEEEDGFDVEDVLYTEEQKEKLNSLRTKPEPTLEDKLDKYNSEHNSAFKVGVKVYYGNYDRIGIITFVHEHTDMLDISFSVKVGNVESRYVSPYLLVKREVSEELYVVPKDSPLRKLSTEKLLKKLRHIRKSGYNNHPTEQSAIKSILKEREHIERSTDVIIDRKTGVRLDKNGKREK